jgi:hypothetical protein
MLGFGTIRVGSTTLKKLTVGLLWDLFMVWIALINLGLILFDLSYLVLRPTYFRHARFVTRVYDRVKGIEPNPLTEELLHEAEGALDLISLDPQAPRLEQHLSRLAPLTIRVIRENPFERSGQTRNLGIIKVILAQETGQSTAAFNEPGETAALVEEFWAGSRALLRARLELFELRVRPLLEVNYFREFDLAGHLVDHFWIIDLPFLALFWIEFTSRWTLAVARKRHARWYFFPIFNWYDLLGLFPSHHFRVFRLLRAVSMYLRLRESQLSVVGKDFISRGVAYISNIITEEVSDRVAVRILEEYQEEIIDGTHLRIIRATVGPRRHQIESVLVRQLQSILADQTINDTLRQLLRVNLENAVEGTTALRALPLPNAVLKPVIRTAGEVILDATLQTISSTLDSKEGQQAVRDVARAVLDQLFSGDTVAEVETLARDISLHVIEHMKETVAVKKWAQPDSHARAISTAQTLDQLIREVTETEPSQLSSASLSEPEPPLDLEREPSHDG